MTFFQYFPLTLLLLAQAIGAAEPVSTGYFNSTAIGGHDLVSYRGIAPSENPKKGDKRYTVNWKGAEWHFISEADSKLFAANPEKYSPAYNGHCANALSLGEGLIKTNGKNWAIFDDQLYLFYASRGTQRWLSADDYKIYKAAADQAWKEIVARGE